MATPATVREWHDAEGWGVVDSEATPGGCWAHFSDVAVAGYRNLQPGAGVRLEWEVADQDGYRFGRYGSGRRVSYPSSSRPTIDRRVPRRAG